MGGRALSKAWGRYAEKAKLLEQGADIVGGRREPPSRQPSPDMRQAFDSKDEPSTFRPEPVAGCVPEIAGHYPDIVRCSGHPELIESINQRREAFQYSIQFIPPRWRRTKQIRATPE